MQRHGAAPHTAAAAALSAVDGAQWAALRALAHLEAESGSVSPQRRRPLPPPTSAPPGIEAGAEVLLRDVRLVADICARIGCTAGPVQRYAGGRQVGVVQSMAEGGVAAVSFGDGRVVAVPAAALVAARPHRHSPRRTPGAVSPPPPPPPPPHQQRTSARAKAAAEAEKRRSAQLLRSLQLRSQQLQRRETELTATRREVAILRRQLDKAGAAAAARALLHRHAVVTQLPAQPLAAPKGTEIAHWSEVHQAAVPAGSLILRTRPGEAPGRRRRVLPPAEAGVEHPLGGDGYVCALVSAPRDGGGGVVVSVHNATEDLQVDLTLKAGEGAHLRRIDVQGRTRALWDPAAPRTFRVRLFPGETVPLVLLLGHWNEWSASYSYGPVTDTNFLRELTVSRGGAVAAVQQHLRRVCKAAGLDADCRLSTELHRVVAHCRGSTEAVSWIDPQFPPCAESLVGDVGWPGVRAPPRGWLRLHEVVPHQGTLQLGAVHPSAVDIGHLGSAALAGAAAAVAEVEGELMRVFDTRELRLASDDVAAEHRLGAWRVRLCPGGFWRWCLIDDWVPAADGAHQCPFGLRGKTGTVYEGALWPALLEKAAAKTRGSYAAAAQGPVQWHLHALTGEPCEALQWADDAYSDVVRHLEDGDIVVLTTPAIQTGPQGVLTDPEDVAAASTYTGAGLVMGQAYRVVGYCVQGGHRLANLRNPWSDASQWRGDWGKGSPAWSQHPEAMASCGLSNPEDAGSDGTFWMDWADVLAFFTAGCVCLSSNAWAARVGRQGCWDVRLRSEFRAGMPATCVLLRCHAEVVLRASTAQPAVGSDYSATRLEIVESTIDGDWQVVVSSGPEYVRGHTSVCEPCHLRAGGTYAVVLSQWPREDQEALLTRTGESAPVLRLCFSDTGFGSVSVRKVTPSMAEALGYEGYPDFDILSAPEEVVHAQVDGADRLSAEIAPHVAPHATAPVSMPPRSAVDSDSDEDSDAQPDLPTFRDLGRRPLKVDPSLAAGRIRMHLSAGSADPLTGLHPHDKQLLHDFTEAMERGRPAVGRFLSKLYTSDE